MALVANLDEDDPDSLEWMIEWLYCDETADSRLKTVPNPLRKLINLVCLCEKYEIETLANRAFVTLVNTQNERNLNLSIEEMEYAWTHSHKQSPLRTLVVRSYVITCWTSDKGSALEDQCVSLAEAHNYLRRAARDESNRIRGKILMKVWRTRSPCTYHMHKPDIKCPFDELAPLYWSPRQ